MITLTERERKVLAHAMMTRNAVGTPEEFVAQHVAAAGEERTRARLDATVATWGKNYDDVVAAEGVIVLTDEERAVMDHVLIVETPEHWVARNVAEHGVDQTREWLDAKVARHKPDCEHRMKEDGPNYKNAKQLHAEELQRQQADMQAEVATLRKAQADRNAALKAEILAELRAAPVR